MNQGHNHSVPYQIRYHPQGISMLIPYYGILPRFENGHTAHKSQYKQIP